MVTFSLVINHTPWNAARVACLKAMRAELRCHTGQCGSALINATDYRGTDWQVSKVAWALAQWEWSARQDGASHHVFMTDDLHLAPHFWECLSAMCEANPLRVIGLLNNHWDAPRVASEGRHAYRCNSWLVGPAYVLPHQHLVDFLAWFKGLTFEEQKHANDDSSINEWVTHHGPGESWHPLPTIVEHRFDLPSTVGHGDKYSRERMSWRAIRSIDDREAGYAWLEHPYTAPLNAMRLLSYWSDGGPMLSVCEAP